MPNCGCTVKSGCPPTDRGRLKIDLATPEQLAAFHAAMKEKGYAVYDICAPIHEGTDRLLKAIAENCRPCRRPC